MDEAFIGFGIPLLLFYVKGSFVGCYGIEIMLRFSGRFLWGRVLREGFLILYL